MNDPKRRAVVTGLGLVSSIGCALDEVREALRSGRSGLKAAPELLEAGLRCGVLAPVIGWDPTRVPKAVRQMGSGVAMYATVAAKDALADAGLDIETVDPRRMSAVVGTAFGGISEIMRMQQFLKRGKKRRAGAAGVAKFMNSTASGNLAVLLGLHGRAYSPSTSFASGADCIGQGQELIEQGLADVVICGASEEECWQEMGPYFDNLNLMATDYNDTPERACRPYDMARQGLVLTSGSGILVLESLDHARGRGARIYAEAVGYGSANDGDDLFRPSGDGLARALREALSSAASRGVEEIDYVNTHGTGTRVGDVIEASVLREVVGEEPYISSTKGLTGHGLGAAGAIEAVLALLMIGDGFVAPTANLESVDPECGGLRHVRAVEETPLTAAMSFSVGLGGTNGALVWRHSDYI